MNELFLRVINISISASWMVMAVLILRLMFRKAPKWLGPVLWGMVGLRLILPFSIDSPWNLIPSAQTINVTTDAEQPHIASGIQAVDKSVNAYIETHYYESAGTTADHFANLTTVLGCIWIFGMVLLMLYTIISYERIRRKTKTAVKVVNNVYFCENVISPFVLGSLRPRIYLPFDISEQDKKFIIEHEQMHIRHHDHWMKPVGYALLILHWFNPLMWVAYILFCKDIELACDESVIRKIGKQARADYAQTLLNYSIPHRAIVACPIAFGEISVKERVAQVLNYKKPAFWIIGTATVVCVAMAMCFLSNPGSGTAKERKAWEERKLATERDRKKLEEMAVKSAQDAMKALDEMQALADEKEELQQTKEKVEKEISELHDQIVLLEKTDNDEEAIARVTEKKEELKMKLVQIEERINEITAEEERRDKEENFGVLMKVKNLTPSGGTLEFRHKEIWKHPNGTLTFGDDFVIEKADGDEWKELPVVVDGDYGFNDVAYNLEKWAYTEAEINWEWLYGKLSKGKYRLSKTVTDTKDSGGCDEYTVYAQFIIE